MKVVSLLMAILYLSISSYGQVVVEDTSPRDDYENRVFNKVEVHPEFPGGDKEWQIFFSKKSNGKSIIKFINVGNHTNLEKGPLLQFIVSKSGAISNIEVINNTDLLLKKEAIRIMELSPKWIPATQNGRIVNAYRKVLINFSDEERVIVPAWGDDDNKIFSKVEVEASFPGGDKIWLKFLEKNLKPAVPINNAAPAGSYTVMIQFIVSKDGYVSDITAVSKHGYGMEAEVIRVIKKTGKWEPAMQNDKPVNAYRRQPITFIVL